MTPEEMQRACEAMIKKTYEDLGMAVMSIEPAGISSFKCGVIDANGPKEVLITVLLQMTYLNAHQR